MIPPGTAAFERLIAVRPLPPSLTALKKLRRALQGYLLTPKIIHTDGGPILTVNGLIVRTDRNVHVYYWSTGRASARKDRPDDEVLTYAEVADEQSAARRISAQLSRTEMARLESVSTRQPR
ncbi:hypothetical protein ACQPYK_49855 (plasmid) [Streptosporangium sp. CA-135522]|uniref:hypothetical protein n=1 Tax=Streptosporangium sp. CA-135522 TaxID=3240072 RepID=UPI003D91C62F